MANAVMALRTLGYGDDDAHMQIARQAVEKLMIERDEAVYFQPCVSPVWDTALAVHAFLESGKRDDPRLIGALDWLAEKQILDHVGDWAVRRPGLRPGGWAFQYQNPDYPDVDDTAVVVMAMHRADPARYGRNIDRACEWLAGMQSKSGGWGAFEPENEHFYLNSIPFADHGALLDPPTVDVTARCVGALAQVDARRFAGSIKRGIGFIRREQEPGGTERRGRKHVPALHPKCRGVVEKPPMRRWRLGRRDGKLRELGCGVRSRLGTFANCMGVAGFDVGRRSGIR
jgi:squalene-hopene/tetraprenyl-beta-curcumene cyclase